MRFLWVGSPRAPDKIATKEEILSDRKLGRAASGLPQGIGEGGDVLVRGAAFD